MKLFHSLVVAPGALVAMVAMVASPVLALSASSVVTIAQGDQVETCLRDIAAPTALFMTSMDACDPALLAAADICLVPVSTDAGHVADPPALSPTGACSHLPFRRPG